MIKIIINYLLEKWANIIEKNRTELFLFLQKSNKIIEKNIFYSEIFKENAIKFLSTIFFKSEEINGENILGNFIKEINTFSIENNDKNFSLEIPDEFNENIILKEIPIIFDKKSELFWGKKNRIL